LSVDPFAVESKRYQYQGDYLCMFNRLLSSVDHKLNKKYWTRVSK